MIVGLPLGHSRGVGDYRGRSWRDYLMVEDTVDPRPTFKVLGSIAIGTSLSRQVLLVRSVATMLPRLGSIRGDSRGREGTTVGLEREDRQELSPEALCHH